MGTPMTSPGQWNSPEEGAVTRFFQILFDGGGKR
jgi:hypothetical protein